MDLRLAHANYHPGEGEVVNKAADGEGIAPVETRAGSPVQYYKKDFWSEENLRYLHPHYRLEKSARIVNRLARDSDCSLLDVGCGPATLMHLLTPNISYHGIDIAIREPGPNLREVDFLEGPIDFNGEKFDIVVAQGVFEYVGDFQEAKLAEIATLLRDDGIFVVSYVNFNHRGRSIYWPYSNVMPLDDFRASLRRSFIIRKCFPTSHNWRHNEPGRKVLKRANMHVNINVPFVSRRLGVEYFFICSLSRVNSAQAGA